MSGDLSDCYVDGQGDFVDAEDGWYGDATFSSDDNIDTAVSTNPGGDEGYIALGDGDFVSWA